MSTTSYSPDISHTNAWPTIRFPEGFFELIRHSKFDIDKVLTISADFAKNTKIWLERDLQEQTDLWDFYTNVSGWKQEWDDQFGITSFNWISDAGTIFLDYRDRERIDDMIDDQGNRTDSYEPGILDKIVFNCWNTSSFLATLYIQNLICNYINTIMLHSHLINEDA